MLKKIILVCALLMLPVAAYAQDAVMEQPQWSFEMKAGSFRPDLPEWSRYHSRRDMPEYSASLAYKLKRQVEIGIEGGYLTSKGPALAPLHNNLLTGSSTYTLYPVNAFVLFRGVMNEKQWFVPYVGGGYTKMFYKESVEGQGSTKGSANGYHARAGLQILLDGIDQSSSNSMYMEYGIFHTYLFIEAKYTRAVVSSFNLGGTSFLAGLLFEF